MDSRGLQEALNVSDMELGETNPDTLDEPDVIERATQTEVEVVDSNWFYNNDYYNRMYQDVGGES